MEDKVEKTAVTPAARPEKLMVQDEGAFSNLLDTARFEHMYRVAKLFSESKLVPEHFQGKPADCYIATQMAVRLGVDPFMMLQNTYVVHGRPGMQASLAIALINSSGLFAGPLRYEIEGKDPRAKDYRVRAYGKYRETGETVWGPWVDWPTVTAEGWDSKSGSKWKTLPALMFQYRAATFFARTVCPERLMGMQTAEELADIGSMKAAHVVSVTSTQALLDEAEPTIVHAIMPKPETEPAPTAPDPAPKIKRGRQPVSKDAETRNLTWARLRSLAGGDVSLAAQMLAKQTTDHTPEGEEIPGFDHIEDVPEGAPLETLAKKVADLFQRAQGS